jgi:alpha-tubulin suppressor-like RCC1 family protein
VRAAGPAQGDIRDNACPNNGFTDPRRFNLPAGLLGTPVKIFGGPTQTFILTDQGDVCCCGNNQSGDLGLGTVTVTLPMTLLPSTSIGPRSAGGASRAIVEIAVAHWMDTNATTQYTTYFRCQDGTLWAAGYNQTGACAQGNTTSPQSTIVQCKKTGSVAIADAAKLFAGGYSTNGVSGAYIDTSGKLYLCGALVNGAWGRNTATGSQTLFNQPMTSADSGTVDLPSTYQALDVIMAIGNTTYVRCADKCVYSCGYNGGGQVGIGNTTTPINVMKKLGAGTAVAATLNGTIERMFAVNYRNDAGNNAMMCQLTDGSCYGWGANNNNALPITTTGTLSTPTLCNAPFTAGCPNISKIIAGGSASTSPFAKVMAILANNTIYSWGSARFDGSGNAIAGSSTPVQVALPTRIGSPTVQKIGGVGYYFPTSPAGGTLAVVYSDWSVIGLDNWAFGAAANAVTWSEWLFLQK